MRSPLIQALIERHHFALLSEQNVDSFLQAHEKKVVLFFTENPRHFPESNDVAVVLPELIRIFNEQLIAAVIDADSERALHRRWAFNKWPALVFLSRGEYLGVITGMRDWLEFKNEFERLLAANPSKAPAFTIPLVTESSRGCN